MKKAAQHSYYVGAAYNDEPDRLLVEDSANIELYTMDLNLAQYWYAQAWRGERLELAAFKTQRVDWGMDPQQARAIKNSGLVLARCVRHGQGKPIVERYQGTPIYGSGVEVLIGEVFEAALGGLIEDVTGIAGLTISPMHSGYAIHAGRLLSEAGLSSVATAVGKERPDLAGATAPDGTVTILFSDIEDSTAMNEEMGDARWMELLREHNAIVRRHKALHHGYEVKTIGDAFMIAFQSAKDALRCALGIQRAFVHRNGRAPQQVRVRIGLHTGELVREGDDFFGRHVNYAARVAGEAAAGEILVSSLLRDLVRASGEFTFDECPKRPLKGFVGEHQLFAVRDEAPADKMST